jgi:hypothetical protein
MIAVITAVDYLDEISATLPYNRHHFSEVVIVTNWSCGGPLFKIAEECNARTVTTNAFYERGASFNKYAAVEQALAVLRAEGKLSGAISVMDADIFIPKGAKIDPVPGCLYTPYRRMCPTVPPPDDVPPEHNWANFPRHRLESEWSGYMHVFHADDPLLGSPPWYNTSWVHAGGADSWFSQKWPLRLCIRPDWECLHVGTPATNWYGRVTPDLTGREPEQATTRKEALVSAMRRRRQKPDPQFRAERLA